MEIIKYKYFKLYFQYNQGTTLLAWYEHIQTSVIVTPPGLSKMQSANIYNICRWSYIKTQHESGDTVCCLKSRSHVNTWSNRSWVLKFEEYKAYVLYIVCTNTAVTKMGCKSHSTLLDIPLKHILICVSKCAKVMPDTKMLEIFSWNWHF